MNSVLRITLLNLLAASVFAAASKKSADLSLLPPDQPVDVIIQYKVKPGATQLNRLQGYGAAVKGELGLIRAVVVVGDIHDVRDGHRVGDRCDVGHG